MRRRGQRGQGLIETAFCAVFLVLLLIGMLGMGRMYTASIRLASAAREGARAGAMGADNNGIQSAALKTLSNTGEAAGIPGTYWMQITPSDPNVRVFNTQLQVDIYWQYPIAVPMFNLVLTNKLLHAMNIQSVTAGIPQPQ